MGRFSALSTENFAPSAEMTRFDYVLTTPSGRRAEHAFE
jgi:hypothetical protein